MAKKINNKKKRQEQIMTLQVLGAGVICLFLIVMFSLLIYVIGTDSMALIQQLANS